RHSGRRLQRHVAGDAVEPDVVRQDECEAAKDAIPGDSMADRSSEGERALLTLAQDVLAERLRLLREMVRRGIREHGPGAGEVLTLPVDAAVREQEAADEGEQDGRAADRGDEDDRVGLLALALDLLARKKVDGAHQSSIPSPIATAKAPSWPLELMPCPEPTRANGSATRTLMPISSSSCPASPWRWAPPPVIVISAKPRES